MKKGFLKFGFFILTLLGIYLINFGFNFIVLPNIFLSIEKWIFIISGVLLILTGFDLLKKSKSVISSSF
jgi:sulfite exporter TauE/SafE